MRKMVLITIKVYILKHIFTKSNSVYPYVVVVVVAGDRSRGRPEGSLFNSYYPKV